MPTDHPDRNDIRRRALVAQLATDLVGPALVGLLLDWQFGWMPWATVSGLVLGLGMSFYHLALLAKKMTVHDDDPSNRGTPT